MSLLASREVRWFGARDERSEAALKNWIEHQDPYDPDERFLAEGIWDPPDTREDKYAIVPASVDMGIKWREDQLQVKGRREDCGIQCFAGGAQGRVEQWLKWSYKGKEISAAFLPWFDSKSATGPRIVAVGKARALRRVRVDGRGSISEVSSQKGFSDRGINVELTWLNVLGQKYWSLGLEAFPDDSAMSSAFTEVADNFLAGLHGVELGMKSCFSYPGWLVQLEQTGHPRRVS